MKSFSVREICVYIERCWQHRKNKDRKTLYSHILIIIISAKSLWESIWGELNIREPLWPPIPDHDGFSALHCISYFGIAEVADTLIKMDRWGVNQQDGAGMTPLIWAASLGHEEVVRLLLGNKHIRPDRRDSDFCRTALSWAAGNGHKGVVRLFLRPRFSNPGSIGGRWGKVARVVDVLFGERYVDPDSLGIYYRTPLSWAAESGHGGIVRLLLEREGVNPNIPDMKDGRTPLSFAAKNGHEGTVRLLLGRKNVYPDIPSRYEGTPLSLAAKNGHRGIVKLLLGRKDVNPNSSSGSGQTPLFWAAWSGHHAIIELLLGREDVDPNTLSKMHGQTLLTRAAENGHVGIVKLLLGWRGVNPDIPDTYYGRTPLSLPAENGHVGVVKLLLGREDVNPDSSNECGETPLILAARNGHCGVAEQLRSRKSRRTH